MITLPVHAAAEGILRGQALDPAGRVYWTSEVCEIRGDVDLDRLLAAVTHTVRDAEALRVTFVDTDEGPRQRVPEPGGWSPTVVRVPESASWPEIRALVTAAIPTADPAAGPLFDVTLYHSHDRVWWATRAHHAVLDGYGYSLLYRQVSRRYRGRLRDGDRFGRLATLVAADVAHRDSDDYAGHRDYWRRRLTGVTARSFSPRVAMPSGPPLRRRRELPAAALREAGPRWPHRLLAGVAVALHRHTGEETVVVGMPVADRLGTAAADVPAMAMNIAPVPVTVGPGASLDDVVAAVADDLRASRPHQRYRYENLRRDLSLGNRRLFGPVVNVIPFAEPPVLPGCAVTVHHVSAGPVDDVAVTARGPEAVTVEANPEVYDASELDEITDLIADALTRTRAGRWEPLPPTAPPRVTRRHDAYRDHAVTTPDAPAVEAADTVWTYAALARHADRVAASLARRGVGAGDLVGLRLPRGAEAVATILGVLSLGAGYLPVDPAGGARTARILASAAPRLTVAAPVTDEDAPPPVPPDTAPADTAYVIHTSGSTGEPKGVPVSRGALDHFVSAAVETYGLSPGDRVLQFAPLHFDAHVEEVFPALAVGATVVVRDDSATRSIPEFVDFVADRRITVLDLPTAYWHELVVALRDGLTTLPERIHTVIIGGEAAQPARVSEWHRVAPPGMRLWNTYGPTETTVVCLAGVLTADTPVHLGRPLPGLSAALGPHDELLIAGPTLTRAEPGDDRFVTVDGTRWYRTGDVVTRDADGLLRYQGRRDNQVKISGHRVHPEEVTAALARLAGVTEAAVVAVTDAGRTRLAGYAVADRPGTELRRELADALPEVMVPGRIVVLDRLPRTSTGKIDHRRLADDTPAPAPEAPIAPADPVERRILAVFREVLGHAVTAEDDFFAAGGTSLTAVAAATRLSTALERDVTAAALFTAPTASGLRAHLAGRAAPGDDAALAAADVAGWRSAPAAGPTDSDRRLLVTGATGFVGAHVLAELPGRGWDRIVCLGRGGMTRLRETADRLGLPSPDTDLVETLDTDLAAEGLGWTGTQRRRLAGADVVHCAAGVSLTRGYATLRRLNVLATRELLEAVRDGGGRFHHVSTVAVGAGTVLPEDFVPLHAGIRDGYQRTKWAAEEMARLAAADGVPVAVYRLGRVVAAETTGRHNPNDLVSRVLAAADRVGCLPDLPVSEPWLPADVVGRSIAALAAEGSTGVWNLVGAPVRLTDAWRELRPGTPVVPPDEWRVLLAADSRSSRDSAALAAFFESHVTPATGGTVENQRFAGRIAVA
ncbi:nonribosomal peptide synthetase MxcG [Stackebrandtia albiflava]|uniref:Nonribosomal peptide synthetase MxcG n=1 Tax=Stackebrandtia albiflava TaxID=406432 RepID=A0A562VBG8_9ACTN|nr:AMP-binding protein [Stackebrandtia albiflava]TWJ15208.1 nonribosomal peptide synthetase MxcG [Stackebrandtia albiflava]